MPLTDTAIRSAKPASKPRRLFDSGGMYLEIAPSGGKWWRFKYRFAGKEKRLSLGVYPDTSLALARAKRDEARALLAQGLDPGAERRAKQTAQEAVAKAARNTFETVARQWLAVKAHEWTPKQHDKEEARLVNHAFPWIGKMSIAVIGVADIRPLLDRVSKRGHLEQARRLRFQLSRIFRFAVANEYADRDPAADLKAVLPSRRKQNFATITDPAKIGELLRALDGFGGTFPVACALKLAPMLFVRPGELRAAEWTEICLDHPDGPQWIIPPARRKLRRAEKENPSTLPHIVPLPEQAVAILRELHPLTGHRQHLFPGLRDPRQPISDNTLNAGLRRIGYDKTVLVAHGFRHMASTLLNELGFSPDAIEAQLSHKQPGVRAVYNKAVYLPERKKMMQSWADYLDGLRERDGKVVAIHHKAAA
jgi:integrase